MRTASWSSPRPRTSKVSPDSVGHTSMDTLPSTSLSRRARIWRDVTNLPSRPESGDVFTPKVMLRVGASTSSRGSGRGSPGSVSVSPMVTSGRPATETMSPAGRLLDLDPLDAVGGLEARDRAGERDDPAGLDRPGGVIGLLAHDRDPLAHPDRAVADPPDRHPADVLVGGQVGDEQLERMPGHEGRRRRDRHEEVQERPQVGPGHGEIHRRGPELGVRVHDRELDLVRVRAEVHEQLVDGVEDLGRAGASPRSILFSATTTGRRRAIAFWST